MCGSCHSGSTGEYYWFRQIQAMHRSTLELKLRIQSLGKLLAHQVALYSPTCAQLPQMLVGWKRLATVTVHLKARVQTCECVVLFPFSHLVLRVSLQQRETSTNWGLSSYTLENAWELLRSCVAHPECGKEQCIAMFSTPRPHTHPAQSAKACTVAFAVLACVTVQHILLPWNASNLGRTLRCLVSLLIGLDGAA